MQLGGPRVMGHNGVSHHVVRDDLEGVATVLRLLAYAPADLAGGGAPTLPTSDPVDRVVGYLPGPGEKLDARAAIEGERGGEEEGWFSRKGGAGRLYGRGEPLMAPAFLLLNSLSPFFPLSFLTRCRDHAPPRRRPLPRFCPRPLLQAPSARVAERAV
jgi:hypothetical protein